MELISTMMSDYHHDAPESGLEIFHDSEEASTQTYEFTIGEILENRETKNDILTFFKRASSPERHERRRQEIIQSYVDAVNQARQSGAQLLHSHFDAHDFDHVFNLYPEALERWLEGMDSNSSAFVRRVRLAEGFFVGLCEAALRNNSSFGIDLWRALRKVLVTRFIDHIGSDRLKYAPFTAPEGPEVHAVLEELYALDETQTDEDLLDIVLAARRSGRAGWLQGMIFRDEKSPCPAHRRRAAFIQPLVTRPVIAGDSAWPSGEPISEYEAIRNDSWITAQREAFAGHWLRNFAEADTPEVAHASWLLFIASSDRRARFWMADDYARYASTDGPCEPAKKRFLVQQRNSLQRSIADNEKSLKQRFSNKRITRHLQPWRSM